MPMNVLSNFILLPELKLKQMLRVRMHQNIYVCEKLKTLAVCPRCATASGTGYDRRKIRVEDNPIRGFGITLVIYKRRLWCKPCQKPFTEPIQGILPRRKTTQRFRKAVAWAAENFTDLKRVKRAYHCSNDFIYNSLYEQLELRRRTRLYPWPDSIGIDEHNFRRVRGRNGYRQFVTMVVDHRNKRLFEVAPSKTSTDLKQFLGHIEGRENVKKATIDMCDSYKNFIRDFFPNAEIIADKFHVLRLITPHINILRKNITGDKRSNPIRKLLLRSAHKLEYFERSALHAWLEHHPDLNETYSWKERIHAFYRIKGFDRATRAFTYITDQMAASKLTHILALRRTLMRWRKEILNYFKFNLTNARTEGFNNVAKVIKRRSYGFRNFENYRLRLLNACS